MISLRFFRFILIACLISQFSYLSSCKKELPLNPYDIDDPNDSIPSPDLQPNTIQWLHYYMFKPTCANSGCHDGTFEPDYRTVESTYNTLVFAPIVKNDSFGTYTYRVVPGSYQQSIIYRRLTSILNEDGDMMPLEVEPGSDFNERKTEYINAVKTWIQNGAPDMFGDDAFLPNLEPQLRGVQAYRNGANTPLVHDSYGFINVTGGTSTLDIWFAFDDDSTAISQFTTNEIKFCLSMNNMDSAIVQNITYSANPKTEVGYYGDTVNYYYKTTLNDPLLMFPNGAYVFMRVYVDDGDHSAPTEIPELYSPQTLKQYCTLKMP